MRAKIVSVLAAAVVFVAGCSGGDVPELDAVAEADLQARAFMRACEEVHCAGSPIYAPASTSMETREAIGRFTDEVEYLTPSEIDDAYAADDYFENHATLIGVDRVGPTERDDVVGVDVSVSQSRFDVRIQTYLFLWNGDEWTGTSAEAVNVTVTSTVS